MPIFISQGRYSQDAMRGMAAMPEDRTEPVSKLIEAAGGKLLGYYVTFGEYDWLLVVEAPDAQTVSAAVITAAAGGGVTDMKTTLAMTGPRPCKPSAPQVIWPRTSGQPGRQRNDRSLGLKERGSNRHLRRRQGLVDKPRPSERAGNRLPPPLACPDRQASTQ